MAQETDSLSVQKETEHMHTGGGGGEMLAVSLENSNNGVCVLML